MSRKFHPNTPLANFRFRSSPRCSIQSMTQTLNSRLSLPSLDSLLEVVRLLSTAARPFRTFCSRCSRASGPFRGLILTALLRQTCRCPTVHRHTRSLESGCDTPTNIHASQSIAAEWSSVILHHYLAYHDRVVVFRFGREREEPSGLRAWQPR
jgi:hypothetical protein